MESSARESKRRRGAEGHRGGRDIGREKLGRVSNGEGEGANLKGGAFTVISEHWWWRGWLASEGLGTADAPGDLTRNFPNFPFLWLCQIWRCSCLWWAQRRMMAMAAPASVARRRHRSLFLAMNFGKHKCDIPGRGGEGAVVALNILGPQRPDIIRHFYKSLHHSGTLLPLSYFRRAMGQRDCGKSDTLIGQKWGGRCGGREEPGQRGEGR